MFLSNMLRLYSHIRLHGTIIGTIFDAPFGYLVLETSENAKVCVPAGGTIDSTTTVYDSQLWQLNLNIHLPSNISCSVIRSFVLGLDSLIHHDNQFYYQKSSTGLTTERGVDRDSKLCITSGLIGQHSILVTPGKRWHILFKAVVNARKETSIEPVRAKVL